MKQLADCTADCWKEPGEGRTEGDKHLLITEGDKRTDEAEYHPQWKWNDFTIVCVLSLGGQLCCNEVGS